MMPSTSKSARSRFSSPLHLSSSPASHNKGVTTDGQRKFLQRWLEPPVQNKASFQEAGLMRGGVVENMAPLGTLPKHAKKQQTPVGGEGSPAPTPAPTVRKIVLKKPATAARVSPVEEAVAVPTIESPGKEEPFSPTRPVYPINGMDDEDDDDYTPVPKKGAKSRRSSVGPVAAAAANAGGGAARTGRPSRRSNAALAKSSSPSTHSHPTHELAASTSDLSDLPTKSPSIQTQTTIGQTAQRLDRASQAHQLVPKSEIFPGHEPDIADMPRKREPNPFTDDLAPFKAPASVQREPENKEAVDKIVDVAIQEALAHHRYPTAYALQIIYDQYHLDPHFVSMFEDVFHQRADIEALAEFNRLLEAHKRDGKFGDKAFYYWVVTPGTWNKVKPPAPQPAPYSALLTMDLTPAKTRTKAEDFEPDQHIHKKLKIDDQSDEKPDLDDQGDVEMDDALSFATQGGVPATTGDRMPDRDTTPTPAAKMSTGSAAAPSSARLSGGRGVAALENGVKAANGTSNVAGGLNGAKAHKSPHKSPHKSAFKSPGKRKGRITRSQSVSSDSSLSSVPDDALTDYDEFMDQVDEEMGIVSRPSTAEPNDVPAPTKAAQPIKGRQNKAAAKKKKETQSPDLPDSSSDTTHQHQRKNNKKQQPDSDMPAVIAVNGKPSNNSKRVPKSAGKATKTVIKTVEGSDDAHARLLIQKKVTARNETHDLTKDIVANSFSRIPLLSEPLEEELPAPLPSRSARTPVLPALSLRAARAKKRHNEGADEATSPTVALRSDFEPPSSARSSRAATPSNPRTAKKPRGGLRVKTSPMKKKGSAAGIPRGSSRPSPVLGGPVYGGVPQHDKDDNDDSCFTCNGSGELVCCDGCNYSFHFLCIDPPIDEDVMPDEWYCHECTFKYFPEKLTGHRGAFGTLLDALDRKNPNAFRLPQDVRDAFEGVKTGADGEYEEVTSTRPKPSKKGVVEDFDWFRIRDTEGNAVLCHNCHMGSTNSRPIIPCSVCGLNWHLECLDPPLAVPPVLRNWRCPCHMEDPIMSCLGPAHKYRKIKNAPVIEQAYSRGMRNNGWIEVEEDDDEGEDAWTATRRDFGRVYRLPEKGIKLDFLARVHENRAKEKEQQQQRISGGATLRSSNPALPVPSRTVEEQQAALNLSRLHRGNANGVQQLVDALITNAPPAAVSLIAAGSATTMGTADLSQVDHNSLQVMLAHLDAMRSNITNQLARPAAQAREATPQKSEKGDDSTMSID